MLTLDHLPTPATRNIAVHLHPAAERNIKSGHPWLYESGIAKQSKSGQAGDIAVLFDRKRRFLAVGLYDPTSPIRVKVLHHHDPATINQAFFESRLRAAIQHRAPLAQTETTGYRLVYGESDGLPGLILDRYADTLVLKLYTRAWLPHLRVVLAALQAVYRFQRLVLRLSRGMQADASYGLYDGQMLAGTVPDAPLRFMENGLHFQADVIHGHKTGFFFDQRDNRARVAKYANGHSTLDVFAYNGGFSVYAASGGAERVLSLDISEPALLDAQANMRLNRDRPAVADCQHTIMVADAFDGLQALAADGQQFGLVVVDPPAFAKSQSDVDGALAAYRRLTQRALKVVAPAGTLVMASCSSRVPADDFFALVHETAAQAGSPLHEIDRTQHALDHPLRDTFPEGAYLKCLFARA